MLTTLHPPTAPRPTAPRAPAAAAAAAAARAPRAARLASRAGLVRELDTAEEWAEFVAAGDGATVVVDYFTSWCGPCKLIAPKVEAMAAELPSVRFAKINLENTPGAFAREQGVKALPTFHVFRAGVRVGEMSGNNPTKLRSLVDEHVV